MGAAGTIYLEYLVTINRQLLGVAEAGGSPIANSVKHSSRQFEGKSVAFGLTHPDSNLFVVLVVGIEIMGILDNKGADQLNILAVELADLCHRCGTLDNTAHFHITQLFRHTSILFG